MHYSSVRNQDKVKETWCGEDHRQQSQKYYTYHNASGHSIEDFHTLKQKLEKMKCNGELECMVTRTLLHDGVQAIRSWSVTPNRARAQKKGVHQKEKGDSRNCEINILDRT